MRRQWQIPFRLFSGFVSSLLLPAAGWGDDLDYTQRVDSWWEGHRFHPSSSSRAEETPSPGPVLGVEEFGGDIQRAIDSLPPGGGTIHLPAGEYEGGFRVVGRSNVRLTGESGTIIRGGENHIIGSERNLDYGAFCEAVHRRDEEAMRIVRELPTRHIVMRDLTFDDSPVRLASCRHVVFEGCRFQKPENRDVGDKDPDGKKVLRWYRPLSVTGIMGLREIWFLDCDFRGHHANAVYLDGAHFSGMVDCRFAGVESLWHNAIILFTNDDLSLDVNGNDRLEPFERRDTSYFVLDGCHFGPGYKRGALAVSGRDILVQNCRVEGPLNSFLVVNAKTSGKKIFYESFGVIVRRNMLDRVDAIVTAEGAANRPPAGVPDWWVWTKYEIGRFTIHDNHATGLVEALREVPRDGQILGPHRIERNGADTNR